MLFMWLGRRGGIFACPAAHRNPQIQTNLLSNQPNLSHQHSKNQSNQIIPSGFRSSRLYISQKWGCDHEQAQCAYQHPFNDPALPLSYWRLDWARCVFVLFLSPLRRDSRAHAHILTHIIHIPSIDHEQAAVHPPQGAAAARVPLHVKSAPGASPPPAAGRPGAAPQVAEGVLAGVNNGKGRQRKRKVFVSVVKS